MLVATVGELIEGTRHLQDLTSEARMRHFVSARWSVKQRLSGHDVTGSGEHLATSQHRTTGFGDGCSVECHTTWWSIETHSTEMME